MYTSLQYGAAPQAYAASAVRPFVEHNVQVDVDPIFLPTCSQRNCIERHRDLPQRPFTLCRALYHPKWLNETLRSNRPETGMGIVLVDAAPCENVYHSRMVRSAGQWECVCFVRAAGAIAALAFDWKAIATLLGTPFYGDIRRRVSRRIRMFLELFGLEVRESVRTLLTDYVAPVVCRRIARVLDDDRSRATTYLRENVQV